MWLPAFHFSLHLMAVAPQAKHSDVSKHYQHEYCHIAAMLFLGDVPSPTSAGDEVVVECTTAGSANMNTSPFRELPWQTVLAVG